jgi:hypothetical protein
MDNVKIIPAEGIGKGFISPEFIPEGKDEWYLRNEQFSKSKKAYRRLRAHEVEALVRNGNYCENWDNVFITDEFDSGLIKNSEFFGFIRIGRCKEAVLEHHDLQLPVGISNSRIVACDIGDDVAIHNVRYLGHFIIDDRCILANIDEMHTTNHAKFGNGIVKDGEPEKVRIMIDLMNETGSRDILPFDGIIPADAYMWAKYRDDTALQEKLKEITQRTFDSRRGYYGTVGQQCVIKNSRILKDVKIGPHCYIKGANKLKNLTINSSEDEPTQIGEGVELVNGIIGFGCHIFYGCKAVRFVLCRNSNLKYGARLINSMLGDNSTISCCEVLNNLIFPAHEQHHNNSFLIASLVMGQSNVAAGATIGSNHNSRANDNEIQAGRGFWPGLCVTLKHSCRFASFVLIAKGDYPEELDIPLPFALVNNNVSKDRLEVMPAFWWQYNMYALARNSWKFRTRDTRKVKVQNIEFDSLAPDTAEEMLKARELLAIWTAKANLGETVRGTEDRQELARIGKDLLQRTEERGPEVLGEGMEKSSRPVVILKPADGYRAYGQMLIYYAAQNLMEYMESRPEATFEAMSRELDAQRVTEWVNFGGQLMPAADADKIRADIGADRLDSWQKIHQRYDQIWQQYPLAKQRHAFAVLREICGADALDKQRWLAVLDEAVGIQRYICDQVYASRKKDFDNPFRRATYRSEQEMTAATGTIEDNSFVKQVRAETEEFKKKIEQIKKRP